MLLICFDSFKGNIIAASISFFLLHGMKCYIIALHGAQADRVDGSCRKCRTLTLEIGIHILPPLVKGRIAVSVKY